MSDPSPRTRSFPRPAVPAALLIALLIPSCSDSPAFRWGPVEIDVILVSPYGPEGAALLEIPGARLLDARLAEGTEGTIHWESVDGGSVVAVILEDPGSVRFVIRVEDPRPVSGAAVVQVADGNDRLRTSLETYEVRMGAAAR